MSEDQDKTRAAAGVKFSSFTEVQPEDGNPIEVVGLRDGDNIRATLTTDLVETNPTTFRAKKGRFAPPPEELSGLTNQRSVNEFLWKYTQEGSDEHEDLKGEHEDLKEVVENGLTLQASIEEGLDLLADKVSALEGAVGEHSLIFTSTQANVRDGQFNLKDESQQLVSYISEAKYILLSNIDRDGKPVDLERIHVGDVLRLSDISGVVAELKVTGQSANVFSFEKLSGELDRLSEMPFDFILLSSFDPAGLATIDYVDERDDTKLSTAGGKMNGLIDMGAQRIVNLGEPTDDSHAVTRGYVESIAHKPPSSGDAPTTTKLWKYCEGKGKHELLNNEFTIEFEGGANNNIHIHLYGYINGRWWVPASTINYTHSIGEVYCTISDYQGAAALGFKGLKWWFMQKGKNLAGNDKYHNSLQGNYYKHAYPESSKLKDQHFYNLNFPSPFPLVKFPKDIHTGEAGVFSSEPEPELEGLPPDVVDMGEVL